MVDTLEAEKLSQESMLERTPALFQPLRGSENLHLAAADVHCLLCQIQITCWLCQTQAHLSCRGTTKRCSPGSTEANALGRDGPDPTSCRFLISKFPHKGKSLTRSDFNEVLLGAWQAFIYCISQTSATCLWLKLQSLSSSSWGEKTTEQHQHDSCFFLPLYPSC